MSEPRITSVNATIVMGFLWVIGLIDIAIVVWSTP
jgi:hypothetical protein